MKKYSYLLLLLLLAILPTSCSLFGGGQHHKKIPGGTVVWRHANDHENITGTQPLISDGMVYYLQDGQLKAATLKNGKVRWSTIISSNGHSNDFSNKMLESKNKLLLDEGFYIDAFNKKSGKLIWKTWVTHDPKEVSGIGFPIMSQDNRFLYAGRKGYVVKVRKSDGKIVRRFPLNKLVPKGVTQGSTSPVVSTFGDHILYVPTGYYDRNTPPGQEYFGGNMFAFNASTGALIWKNHIAYKIPNRKTQDVTDSVTVSPPVYNIAVMRSLIVALSGKTILTVNRNNGEILWHHDFADAGFPAGLDVHENSIYAAGNHYAVKLNLKTGKLNWKRDIIFANGSLCIFTNGRLYFVNDGGGAIWVLDAQDGSVIYRKPPPNYKHDENDVYISSLAVGEGYMVDVGSKAVYCLTVP